MSCCKLCMLPHGVSTDFFKNDSKYLHFLIGNTFGRKYTWHYFTTQKKSFAKWLPFVTLLLSAGIFEYWMIVWRFINVALQIRLLKYKEVQKKNPLTPLHIKLCAYLYFYVFRISRHLCSFDVQICVSPLNKSTFNLGKCLIRSDYHPKAYVHLNYYSNSCLKCRYSKKKWLEGKHFLMGHNLNISCNL